jgi:DNA-binding beta-propeller fold protein YncE
MKKSALVLLALGGILFSCRNDEETDPSVSENPASFREVAQIDLGNLGASEISAYDERSKRLFVVNNDGPSRIDVLDLSAFPTVTRLRSLDVSTLGAANSVSAYDGLLAVALEATTKTDNGRVVFYDTDQLTITRQATVGPLPDMVTFSPDGRLVVTANEGEPNDAYTIDPPGSVSIINVADFSVTTLDFASFAGQQADLARNGFKVFGPTGFAQNIEPEYVAISDDSNTAWVTLQENNGMARVDLVARRITNVFGLGTKDFNLPNNAIDPSDRDNRISLGTWPVRGHYQPDALAFFSVNNTPYLVSANEGDAREYTGYTENRRLSAVTLDPARFPNAATLRMDANLGRLNISTAFGNTDADPEFEEIFVVGSRSFSIWDGNNGSLVYDCGRELENQVIAANLYDDARSDDKGVEPEGAAIGRINNRQIAFIGLERSDAIAVYDVSNPTLPVFLRLLPAGDAPEGVLFVRATQSPNQKSLLIVSSETDGVVKFYQPDNL